MNSRPLCVDLDWTLVRADGLAEGLASLLRRPGSWSSLLRPLLSGPAALKERVAQLSRPEIATLPYREDLVGFLKAERTRGRTIVLATGADRRYAELVAAHLGCVDLVLASDGKINLVGDRKRQALVTRFGERGYDFIGDGENDRTVAASAELVHPAGRAPSLRRFIAHNPARAGRSFGDAERGGAASWLRLIRPHHWAKNLLVAIPLIAAHRLFESSALLATGGAFAAFSAAASSVYLLNDTLDAASDRTHRRKRLRPIASGEIGASRALLASLLLALLALLLTLPIDGGLTLIVAIYLLSSTLYSTWLKRIAPLDTVTLAGLQIARIIGGGIASALPTSPWLLGFAFAILWSFALAKRTAELSELDPGESPDAGRDWRPSDRPLALAFGAALTVAALLTLILYAGSDDALRLYHRPEALWLIIPLLAAWTSRLWLIAWRGLLRADPILWGLSDAPTLLLLVSSGLLVLWGAVG